MAISCTIPVEAKKGEPKRGVETERAYRCNLDCNTIPIGEEASTSVVDILRLEQLRKHERLKSLRPRLIIVLLRASAFPNKKESYILCRSPLRMSFRLESA